MTKFAPLTLWAFHTLFQARQLQQGVQTTTVPGNGIESTFSAGIALVLFDLSGRQSVRWSPTRVIEIYVSTL